MPFLHYIHVILSVVIAASATVWLTSNASVATMVSAIPALLIAALAARYLLR